MQAAAAAAAPVLDSAVIELAHDIADAAGKVTSRYFRWVISKLQVLFDCLHCGWCT